MYLRLRVKEQIVLLLVKLKCDLTYKTLSLLFEVSYCCAPRWITRIQFIYGCEYLILRALDYSTAKNYIEELSHYFTLKIKLQNFWDHVCITWMSSLELSFLNYLIYFPVSPELPFLFFVDNCNQHNFYLIWVVYIALFSKKNIKSWRLNHFYFVVLNFLLSNSHN